MSDALAKHPYTCFCDFILSLQSLNLPSAYILSIHLEGESRSSANYT